MDELRERWVNGLLDCKIDRWMNWWIDAWIVQWMACEIEGLLGG